MKTRILFFTMIAAALTFSCQKAELENNDVVDNGTNNEIVDFVPGPGRILAVTPTGVDTKISYGDAVEVEIGTDENGDPIKQTQYPVVWTNGDAVKVYSENNLDGLEYSFSGDSASEGVFEGEPVEGEKRYAVFPATRAKVMKNGNINVSFGALQKQEFHSSVSANRSNLQLMPMWAEESENGVFRFNNLCAAVLFKFNDYQELRGMKIVNVTITSKDTFISGMGTVNPESGAMTLTGTDDSMKSISVDYSLDISNTNTDTNPSINDSGTPGFLIALPAINYPANDLTVTITDNFGRVFKRVVTKELALEPGKARTFATLPFTFAYGEANSVVVEPGETVSFDAALRYTFEKSLSVESMTKAEYSAEGAYFEKDGVSVEVLWEIAESDTSKDVDGAVVTSATLKEDQITVVANGAGNALVALKDAEGVILWSWHIWVSEYEDQTYTNCSAQGSPTFMDRNLGATSCDPTDKMNIVGLYYQYGRKDPFVISKNFTPATASSSAVKYFNSDVELTKLTKRTSQVARMSWTIKHPEERINYTTDNTSISDAWNRGFYDWLLPVGEINANWGCTTAVVTDDTACKAAGGGYKTIYDPCPEGYRVPDYKDYSGIIKDENAVYADNAWKVDFDGTDKVAYYPLAGTLNSTELNDVSGGVFYYATRGMYWTTTLAKKDKTYGAAGVFYNSTTLHTNSYGAPRIMNYTTAANIRCMKIQ